MKVVVKNHDVCTERPDVHMKWMSIDSIGWEKPVPYNHDRPLPHAVAKKALKYISVLVKDYPFQLRYAMMLPLWYRFTEAWCDSGDATGALSAI